MPNSSSARFADRFAPLTEVTRGNIAESVHVGAVAVVDSDGTLLFGTGDTGSLTFTRSALKPFQAVPLVTAGGIERFSLVPAEVALLCASHSGEARHVQAAAAILAKADNAEGDLQCGTQPPGYFAVRGEHPPPPPYSPLAHNCSGKHAGMLAWCVACGHSRHDYLVEGHPLQVAIRTAVAAFTGIADEHLVVGVDGCSAPNYAVPLTHLARAYARLVSVDDHADYGTVPRRLADAMLAHPEMVSGEGRFDLALGKAGCGDWVAKVGAEGVQAIGIRSRGWGIAVKVADGNPRALHPATVAVLDQLGLLDATARAALAPWAAPVIRNYRGVPTGNLRSVVVLDKIGRNLAPVSASK